MIAYIFIGIVCGCILFLYIRSGVITSGIVKKATAKGPGRDCVVSDEALKRFIGAVKIPTENHSTGDNHNKNRQARYLREFQAFLVREYPKVHAVCRRRLFGDYGILYVWQGRDEGLNPVALLAHYDVVPAESGETSTGKNGKTLLSGQGSSGWVHPPFSGRREGGYIYGRGTLDDKNALISIMESVETMIEQGYIPERSVYICFGGDEESGGYNGAAQIAAYLKTKGIRFQWLLDEGAVVCDGILPSVTRPLILLGVAQKGMVNVVVTAKGQGGHASLPPGTTPAGLLAAVIARAGKGIMPYRLTPLVKTMFRNIAAVSDGIVRHVFANIDILWPAVRFFLRKNPAVNVLITSTVAPTVMQGAETSNVLPQKVSCGFNVRILPGDTVETVKSHFFKALRDIGNVEIRLDPPLHDPSFETQLDHPGYEYVKKAALSVFPDGAAVPFLVNASSDSEHYRELTDGIIRFAPLQLAAGELELIHNRNERISEQNFARGIAFYMELLSMV